MSEIAHLGGDPGAGQTPARHLQGLRLDLLAAWVTASPDGVLVLDSDLRVVYASPAYCALFGLQPDRLLGQDVLRFVPELHRQTALTHWADGGSEPVGSRSDRSELELEVRPVQNAGKRGYIEQKVSENRSGL